MNVVSTSIAALVGATASLSFGGTLSQPADLISSLKPQTVHVASVQKSESKVAAQPVEEAAAPTTPQPVMVTVQPGDYLEKIATANNSTTQRVFAANVSVKDPNVIYPSQQLRIPTADETLADRPLPVPAQAAPVATPAPAAPKAKARTAPTTSSTTSTSPRRVAKPTTTAPAVAGSGVWDRLAACEAGGNWSINTGNGYYGGLQFNLSSWRAVGGTGLPSDASREEQIMRGQMLQARQGWGAWPSCSAKLGLR